MFPQVGDAVSHPFQRTPAGGARVLAGIAKAVDSNGRDVTAYLVSGAERALEKARANGIRIAVLKEGSPSCGSGFIYDGSFSGTRISGQGVTPTRLRQAGVQAFSEHQLAEADALLRQLEADDAG